MTISYIIAVVLRLIPFLALDSLPFYDPWAYYFGVIDYKTGGDTLRQSVFHQGHPGFYSLIIVIYELTDLPLIPYFSLFPPLFNSLSILPMYLITRTFFKNEKAAVISALLFSVMEIVVLRQSYLIPEGLAIYFMLLTFYFIFKDPHKISKMSQAIVCFILFYCLCSLHNLTSSMTLIPILVTLIGLITSQIFRLRLGGPFEISRALNFVIYSIGLSFIWIFWGKDLDYAGFIGNFILLNFDAILLTLSAQATPTPEGFTEHYYTTQESSSVLNLISMNSGSLIITLIGIFGFFRLLKTPRKETQQIFLIYWSISMLVNFALNIVIDSIFTGRTYAQQAYRAWIFFIIPVIILASIRIAEIQNDKVMYMLLSSSLIFCLIGAVWFNMFLMDTFPHLSY